MSDGQQEQDDGGGGGGTDPRLEVMEEYTLKTLKIKGDKWAKVNKISHLISSNDMYLHVPYMYASCCHVIINVDAKSRGQCNTTK